MFVTLAGCCLWPGPSLLSSFPGRVSGMPDAAWFWVCASAAGSASELSQVFPGAGAAQTRSLPLPLLALGHLEASPTIAT